MSCVDQTTFFDPWKSIAEGKSIYYRANIAFFTVLSKM